MLTEKGRQTLDDAMRLQIPWVISLSGALPMKEIETAHRVVGALRKKLEGISEGK